MIGKRAKKNLSKFLFIEGIFHIIALKLYVFYKNCPYLFGNHKIKAYDTKP
jgi:hypothetical protein